MKVFEILLLNFTTKTIISDYSISLIVFVVKLVKRFEHTQYIKVRHPNSCRWYQYLFVVYVIIFAKVFRFLKYFLSLHMGCRYTKWGPTLVVNLPIVLFKMFFQCFNNRSSCKFLRIIFLVYLVNKC